MRAISSYRGNDPPTHKHTHPHTHTHRQDRLQYTAPQQARSVTRMALERIPPPRQLSTQMLLLNTCRVKTSSVVGYDIGYEVHWYTVVILQPLIVTQSTCCDRKHKFVNVVLSKSPLSQTRYVSMKFSWSIQCLEHGRTESHLGTIRFGSGSSCWELLCHCQRYALD